MDEQLSYMENQLKQIQAALFHIRCIEEEEDPEIIKIHLEALQKVEDSMTPIWIEEDGSWYETGDPKRNVKEDIRNKFGNYAKLTDKCVRLGLV